MACYVRVHPRRSLVAELLLAGSVPCPGRRRLAMSTLSQPQLVEHTVEFIQRAKCDRDLAAICIRSAPLEPDLDRGGQAVGELFFQAGDVARFLGGWRH